MICFSSSNSSVERAFNLLTMLLMNQRLTSSQNTLYVIFNIKINGKVFTEREKNEIVATALNCFLEKRKDAVFEENTPVG